MQKLHLCWQSHVRCFWRRDQLRPRRDNSHRQLHFHEQLHQLRHSRQPDIADIFDWWRGDFDSRSHDGAYPQLPVLWQLLDDAEDKDNLWRSRPSVQFWRGSIGRELHLCKQYYHRRRNQSGQRRRNRSAFGNHWRHELRLLRQLRHAWRYFVENIPFVGAELVACGELP